MAGIQDSDFKKGWDSGFRFQMTGIQDSDYVFQGHNVYQAQFETLCGPLIIFYPSALDAEGVL